MIAFSNINEDNVTEFIAYCINNKVSKKDLELYLKNCNLNEEFTEVILKKFTYQLSFKLGLQLLLIGSILLILAFFAPFVISFTNVLFNITLYGFTTLGGILGLYGLYKIIG